MKINRPQMICLFTLVLCTAFTLKTKAQVAVIDSKKISAAMPDMMRADSLFKVELKKYQNEYQIAYEAQQASLKFADSLNKINPKEETAIKARNNAAEQLEKVKQLAKNSNAQIENLRRTLLSPYIDKLNAAVKQKATELKYKQVIDLSQTPLFWFNPATDITAAVIRSLKSKK